MKITDSIEEMSRLGRQFLMEHPDVYPEEYVRAAREKFGIYFENDPAFLAMLYCGVYCQQVYGVNLLEFFIYHFTEIPHSERIKYITWDSRFPYMAFLNRATDNHILDNKYEAYSLLKPFYKREAMLLSGEEDYGRFCSFMERHGEVYVKPNNLELAEGAHRLKIPEDGNLRVTFDALRKEAAEISSTVIKRKIDHRLILEEVIPPSAFIRGLNPREMSLLRVTTVYVKGQVHFFYPCLRLLVGDGMEQCGEDYSYVALIDPESGKVITNGKNGCGDSDINPVTGLQIQGMVMPEWDALKEMLVRAAEMLPGTRYIGWDVTHTEQGWCIIEGNTNGEFFFQMCLGHGLKEEFEDLIGFRVPYDFWKNSLFQKKRKPLRE